MRLWADLGLSGDDLEGSGLGINDCLHVLHAKAGNIFAGVTIGVSDPNFRKRGIDDFPVELGGEGADPGQDVALLNQPLAKGPYFGAFEADAMP